MCYMRLGFNSQSLMWGVSGNGSNIFCEPRVGYISIDIFLQVKKLPRCGGTPLSKLILTLVLQAMPKRKGVFPKIPPLRKAIKLNLQKKFGFLQSQFFFYRFIRYIFPWNCINVMKHALQKKGGGAGGAHELIRLV